MYCPTINYIFLCNLSINYNEQHGKFINALPGRRSRTVYPHSETYSYSIEDPLHAYHATIESKYIDIQISLGTLPYRVTAIMIIDIPENRQELKKYANPLSIKSSYLVTSSWKSTVRWSVCNPNMKLALVNGLINPINISSITVNKDRCMIPLRLIPNSIVMKLRDDKLCLAVLSQGMIGNTPGYGPPELDVLVPEGIVQ